MRVKETKNTVTAVAAVKRELWSEMEPLLDMLILYLAGKGDKAHRHQPFGTHIAGGLLFHQHQGLHLVDPADGNNHPPVGLELLQQGRGNVSGRGGYNNRIEGGVLLPAVIAVPLFYLYLVVAVLGQILLRPGCQLIDYLD